MFLPQKCLCRKILVKSMAADFARGLYRHRQKDPDQTKKNPFATTGFCSNCISSKIEASNQETAPLKGVLNHET